MYTEILRSKPPRRAHSLPSRYAMPSEEMGQYEDGSNRNRGVTADAPTRRRSAPARPNGGYGSGLFPLREECTYGRTAALPPFVPLSRSVQQQKMRERKPKIYSSYAVVDNSACSVHSKKKPAAEVERDHRESIVPTRRPSTTSSSFRSSTSPVRRTPQSPLSARRTSSTERVSRSPEQSTIGRAAFPKGGKKVPGHPGFSWASPPSAPNHRRFSSSPSSSYRFRNLRDSSFEENEEYEYEENQRRLLGGGGGEYSSLEGRMGGLSLGGMRRPKINSWDSMGILGLTNKMWHDTKRNQEASFMKSTGYFLRRKEEAVGSYIM